MQGDVEQVDQLLLGQVATDGIFQCDELLRKFHTAHDGLSSAVIVDGQYDQVFVVENDAFVIGPQLGGGKNSVDRHDRMASPMRRNRKLG